MVGRQKTPNLTQDDRRRLVESAKVGDRDAFEQLFRDAVESIRRCVKFRLNSSQDIEDVVQEATLEALRSFTSLRDSSAFNAWLTRLTIRAICRHLAQARNTPINVDFHSLEWLEHEEPKRFSTQPPLNQSVDARLFAEQIVQRLDDVCSAAEANVLRMYGQGLAFPEIASRLDLKQEDVRRLFYRSKGKLLEHLYSHNRDLIGTQEEIDRAYEKARTCGESGRRLSASQKEAWLEPERRREEFRAALIKIAGFLLLVLAVSKALQKGGA
jgi:RNA polymerase sigma-70 factor (ECF subfamily)